MTENLFLLALWTLGVCGFLYLIGSIAWGLERIRRWHAERQAARSWDRARASYSSTTANEALR